MESRLSEPAYSSALIAANHQLSVENIQLKKEISVLYSKQNYPRRKATFLPVCLMRKLPLVSKGQEEWCLSDVSAVLGSSQAVCAETLEALSISFDVFDKSQPKNAVEELMFSAMNLLSLQCQIREYLGCIWAPEVRETRAEALMMSESSVNALLNCHSPDSSILETFNEFVHQRINLMAKPPDAESLTLSFQLLGQLENLKNKIMLNGCSLEHFAFEETKSKLTMLVNKINFFLEDLGIAQVPPNDHSVYEPLNKQIHLLCTHLRNMKRDVQDGLKNLKLLGVVCDPITSLKEAIENFKVYIAERSDAQVEKELAAKNKDYKDIESDGKKEPEKKTAKESFNFTEKILWKIQSDYENEFRRFEKWSQGILQIKETLSEEVDSLNEVVSSLSEDAESLNKHKERIRTFKTRSKKLRKAIRDIARSEDLKTVREIASCTDKSLEEDRESVVVLQVTQKESLESENEKLRKAIKRQEKAHENEVNYLEKYIEELSNKSIALLKNSSESLLHEVDIPIETEDNKKLLAENERLRKKLEEAHLHLKGLKNQRMLWNGLASKCRDLVSEIEDSRSSFSTLEIIKEKLDCLDTPESSPQLTASSPNRPTKDSFINHMLSNPALLQYHIEQFHEEMDAKDKLIHSLRQELDVSVKENERISLNLQQMRESQIKRSESLNRSTRRIFKKNTSESINLDKFESLCTDTSLHLESFRKIKSICESAKNSLFHLPEHEKVREIRSLLDEINREIVISIKENSIEENIKVIERSEKNLAEQVPIIQATLVLYKEKLESVTEVLNKRTEKIPTRMKEIEGINKDIHCLEEEMKYIESFEANSKFIEIVNKIRAFDKELHGCSVENPVLDLLKSEEYENVSDNPVFLKEIIKLAHEGLRDSDKMLLHMAKDRTSDFHLTTYLYTKIGEKDLRIAKLLTTNEKNQGQSLEENQLTLLKEELKQRDKEVIYEKYKNEQTLQNINNYDKKLSALNEEIIKLETSNKRLLNKINTLKGLLDEEKVKEFEDFEPAHKDPKLNSVKELTRLANLIYENTDPSSLTHTQFEDPDTDDLKIALLMLKDKIQSQARSLAMAKDELREIYTSLDETSNILNIPNPSTSAKLKLNNIKASLQKPPVSHADSQTENSYETAPKELESIEDEENKLSKELRDLPVKSPKDLLLKLVDIDSKSSHLGLNIKKKYEDKLYGIIQNKSFPLDVQESLRTLLIEEPVIDTFDDSDLSSPVSEASLSLKEDFFEKNPELNLFTREDIDLKSRGEKIKSQIQVLKNEFNRKVSTFEEQKLQIVSDIKDSTAMFDEESITAFSSPPVIKIMLILYKCKRFQTSMAYHKWKLSPKCSKFPESIILPEAESNYQAESKRNLLRRKKIPISFTPVFSYNFLELFAKLEELMDKKHEADQSALTNNQYPVPYPIFIEKVFDKSTIGSIVRGLELLSNQQHPYALFFSSLLHLIAPVSEHFAVFITKFRHELQDLTRSVQLTKQKLFAHSEPFEEAGTGGSIFLVDILALIYKKFKGYRNAGIYIVERLCPSAVSPKDFLSFVICYKLQEEARAPLDLVLKLNKPKNSLILPSDIVKVCENILDIWLSPELIVSAINGKEMKQAEFCNMIGISNYLKKKNSLSYVISKSRVFSVLLGLYAKYQIEDGAHILQKLDKRAVINQEIVEKELNVKTDLGDVNWEEMDIHSACEVVLTKGLGKLGLGPFCVNELHDMIVPQPKTSEDEIPEEPQIHFSPNVKDLIPSNKSSIFSTDRRVKKPLRIFEERKWPKRESPTAALLLKKKRTFK